MRDSGGRRCWRIRPLPPDAGTTGQSVFPAPVPALLFLLPIPLVRRCAVHHAAGPVPGYRRRRGSPHEWRSASLLAGSVPGGPALRRGLRIGVVYPACHQALPVVDFLFQLTGAGGLGQALFQLLNLFPTGLDNSYPGRSIVRWRRRWTGHGIRCQVPAAGQRFRVPPGLPVRLPAVRSAGHAAGKDLVAGCAERLPEFAVFPVPGDADGFPVVLQGLGLLHGFLQGLIADRRPAFSTMPCLRVSFFLRSSSSGRSSCFSKSSKRAGFAGCRGSPRARPISTAGQSGDALGAFPVDGVHLRCPGK